MESITSEYKDQVVVITGAAGVYGQWLAKSFTEVGAKVCLSDIRMDKLEALASELQDNSQVDEQDILLHETDLRKDESMLDLVDATYKSFGRADVVINNAGLYPGVFLLDIEFDQWDEIMDVNMRAPFVLSVSFAKRMIKSQTQGSIINIGSAAARSMRTTMVPYCISKSGLDRLTKGLALELSPYKIRVNAVEPGFAPGSEASPLTEEHVKATGGRVPLGRIAEPQDLSNAIMFLCSSHASYITGATLSSDGGMAAGSQVVYLDKKEPSL